MTNLTFISKKKGKIILSKKKKPNIQINPHPTVPAEKAPYIAQNNFLAQAQPNSTPLSTPQFIF